MVITIMPGHSKCRAILVSHDLKFRAFPGAELGGTTKHPFISVGATNSKLLSTMLTITTWVNNELGEECLFEID